MNLATEKNDGIEYFASSLDLAQHPMRFSKQKLKTDYFIALEYFINKCPRDVDYIDTRLARYKDLFRCEQNIALQAKNMRENAVRSLANNKVMPWRKKYRYWLLCDIALILLDKTRIDEAYAFLCEFLSKKQSALLYELFTVLWDDNNIPSNLMFAEKLINQFRTNRQFSEKPLKRILVTATMSAGKSTLINALVGRDILETRNEACTKRIHRVFNKPFDDGVIKHFGDDLAIFSKAFDRERICFIDTPGVNHVHNPMHREITQAEIKDGQYDILIYLLNARYSGVADDDMHLRYVLENKPPSAQIVFVLNQLDEYNEDDSVLESLDSLRKHIVVCGIQEPIICPVSAKVGLLVKRVINGEDLNDRDRMWYDIYTEHFSSSAFDLSRFYKNSHSDSNIPLLRSCGLFGLEQTLKQIGGTFQ